MINKSKRSGLMVSTTLYGALLSAVALTAITSVVPTAAVAQDYTSGTLIGTVKDARGAPVANATVTIKSAAQGITRESKTDSNGQFRFALIPIGTYTATVSAEGKKTFSDDSVNVKLGSTSGYDFSLEDSGGEVTEVVVKGRARQRLDFGSTATGAVIDVETVNKQLPIARNMTAVVLLAPSAVQGDTAFSAQGFTQPSVSGASVGENVFYVNGLNITNFVNGIGAATVPFDFYKTVEVKTGGYQAEYGRATGGVINAVSKTGSNEFEAALHVNYELANWREHAPDTYAATNSRTNRDYKDVILEFGGPILKDRVFFYGMYQAPKSFSTSASGSTGTTYSETKYNDPLWAVKLDGYLTSKHHFELTAFDTTQQLETRQFDYNYLTDVVGTEKITAIQNYGGLSYVGRYTGSITDWMTISAAYGVTEFTQGSYNNLVGEPLVQDARSGSTRTISRQTSSLGNAISDVRREFYRADADFYFELFGKHHIRVGLDHEELTYDNISQRNGGQNWIYRQAAANNTLGLATGQQYVQLRTFNGGGTFTGVNEAYYIQDSWDVTNRLNLNIGFRNDSFLLKDAAGQSFSDEPENKAVRLGFNYDLSGDKSDRIYGFYGRYFLPVAANTAYRAASNNLDVTQSFLPAGGGLTFGALDPVTGKPVAGLGAILVRGVNSTATALAACRQLYLDRGIVPVAVGTLACQVGSGGVPPEPTSISALNVESTSEDEYILGYEHRFESGWKVGASLTYRKLNTAADDMAIDAAVNAYCAANKISGCADIWTGTHQYLIANPGKDVLAVLSDPLPGETNLRTLSLSANALGFPAVERSYKALTITFQRPFDGTWGLQGSYVLSESKGNFEGAVKSDTGQADAGITSDFDLIGFTDGAYGYLPNHHAHQFKLNGSYKVTDDLLLGVNYSLISPRKYGCLGPVPLSRDPDAISSFYNPPPGHYCSASQVGGTGTQLVLAPRAEAFETDWINRVDVSVRYTIPSSIVPAGTPVIRADIFNLFNAQGVTEANETGNLSSGSINANYKKPITYQTPRYVRIGFDISF